MKKLAFVTTVVLLSFGDYIPVIWNNFHNDITKRKWRFDDDRTLSINLGEKIKHGVLIMTPT